MTDFYGGSQLFQTSKIPKVCLRTDTFSTPEPFTSLRLALNILYHKKLNFKKIFTRLNRPDDVNFFDAEVPEKKKTTSTASASSRRKKAKLTKEKAHLEATLEAIAEGENGVPTCFLLTKKQKRKLKEIIHILIRRGAVITKFCLAVAVIDSSRHFFAPSVICSDR